MIDSVINVPKLCHFKDGIIGFIRSGNAWHSGASLLEAIDWQTHGLVLLAKFVLGYTVGFPPRRFEIFELMSSLLPCPSVLEMISGYIIIPECPTGCDVESPPHWLYNN